MSGQQGSGSKPQGSAKTAMLVVSATIFMPFIVFWRSIRSIWADEASRGILLMAALLLVAGTVIFMFIEGFSPLDSFYFCFITLATIGYGDITPTTDLGKLVTVVYGIAGLGVMGALITTIATQHVRRAKSRNPQA